ncbi:TetR/AcrR family transcriptional regulator [Pseudonocardia humida]|uniref:Helix-turn-helix transcriptional regulator n=1 Tax=Pseudonocardia humida TaxID=2800819 RepID=A0ABT1A1H2_9PSEU|nr:TetR/AcrR family transcriptional regulator [Pseudonocardia humida]MCO1656847.1 helix-turn-helix transcriptional regulator [Pseudonocardia humida]
MSPRGRADVDGAAILAAAAELLLERGYDRTTLDDVARAAGVSKSTLYQRWGAREALFVAVLRHQRAAMHRHVLDEINGVEGVVDLRALFAAQVRAYQRHRLMTALLLNDREVLGRLLAPLVRDGAERDRMPRDGTLSLIVRLQAAGLVRADRTLPEVVAVLSSVFHGHFLTAPLITGPLRLPDDEAPALLADVMQQALARPDPLDPTATAALDAAIRDHVTAAVAGDDAVTTSTTTR